MSTDVKLSKVKISKIVQSGGSFGSWLRNLGKKALPKISVPLARDNLPGLVSNLTSNGINKFERKVSEKSSAKEGKGLTLFISNGDMSDIIKIRNILENLSVLIDEVAETVKDEKKTKKADFLELC